MITEKAMLAAVHISIWTAVKHDRKVSRDVADQHGAHQGAGRYDKQLLRGADKLDELRTLAGQIRQYFYKITLPWSDEGFRLLPVSAPILCSGNRAPGRQMQPSGLRPHPAFFLARTGLWPLYSNANSKPEGSFI